MVLAVTVFNDIKFSTGVRFDPLLSWLRIAIATFGHFAKCGKIQEIQFKGVIFRNRVFRFKQVLNPSVSISKKKIYVLCLAIFDAF